MHWYCISYGSGTTSETLSGQKANEIMKKLSFLPLRHEVEQRKIKNKYNAMEISDLVS